MHRTIALVAALLVATPLSAQTKGEFEQQGVRTFKRAEDKAEAVGGPSAASNVNPWLKTQSRELEALDNEIEAVKQLIEMSDPTDVEVPDYYMRLADLYWEKSLWYENQLYSEALASERDQAEKSGDAVLIQKSQAREAEYKTLMGQWREQTVDTYKMIAQQYPNHPNVDAVYYYLGIYLNALGRADEGRDYYIRVVTEFPKSRLFPDALYNIGESFFHGDDFESALKFYERVEIFTDSHVYLLALYKKAWCYFNMAEYDTSFKTFVKTIKATDVYIQKTGKAKLDLREEALRDLVLTYSQVGKPENAAKTFEMIAPDKAQDLTQRLARVYYEQGEYDKSNLVLKLLMKENADSYKLLTFQRMVVDNTNKKGVMNKTVEEVQRLVGLYDKFESQTPPDILKQERDLTSQQLRELATSFHDAGRTTQNPKILNMAHLLYEVYFKMFPSDEYTQDMATNYSVLLLNLELYDKAVVQFERLLGMKLSTEQEKMASHGAVLCYFQIYDISSLKVAEEEDVEEQKAKEIPEGFQRFVSACDRYAAVSSDADEDHVEARFAAAKILFDYNHFADAAGRFQDIVSKYPKSERAPLSARLILACYNLGRDIENLNLWASKLKNVPEVMSPQLAGIIKKIEDQAEFNRCFAYETEKQHEKAALCFLQYTQKFPDSVILDKALYNSAINYNRARQMEKAITALGELYNRAKKSDIRPSALFALAEIYREAAVYSEAAKFYEIYVANHPQHKNVEKALQYASVFRKALGEYDKAIKNYQSYMQRFPKSEKIPNVDFDIGMIYMTQKKWPQASDHFQKFVKKYPEQPDLVLAALLQIAKSWDARKKAKETRKAYENVVAAFDALSDPQKEKLTQGFATVAEARFLLGEFVLAEYAAVKMTSANLEKALTEKLEIIARAKPIFQQVYEMQQPNWMIASTDRLGWAYEQLADTIETAPLPRGLNEEQLEIYRGDLAEKSEKIRASAVEAYKKSLDEAIRFKWFNDYSDHAERHLAKLDFSYKFTKEARAKPDQERTGGYPYSFVRAQLGTGLEL